jgi:hypothetical protein
MYIMDTRYSLTDLPTVLERQLSDRGLTDNRFAVVGFGGPDQLSRPHVFTAGSKIFADSVKTVATLNKFDFVFAQTTSYIKFAKVNVSTF